MGLARSSGVGLAEGEGLAGVGLSAIALGFVAAVALGFADALGLDAGVGVAALAASARITGAKSAAIIFVNFIVGSFLWVRKWGFFSLTPQIERSERGLQASFCD
jgi:hypothetical protein